MTSKSSLPFFKDGYYKVRLTDLALFGDIARVEAKILQTDRFDIFPFERRIQALKLPDHEEDWVFLNTHRDEELYLLVETGWLPNAVSAHVWSVEPLTHRPKVEPLFPPTMWVVCVNGTPRSVATTASLRDRHVEYWEAQRPHLENDPPWHVHAQSFTPDRLPHDPHRAHPMSSLQRES